MNDYPQQLAAGIATTAISDQRLAAATDAGSAVARTRATGCVLVLGSDTRSFLSVVRSLGRYGLTVEAAWTTPGAIALRSRYLHQVHALPTPWDAPEDWLTSFNELMESRRYDLVIPCNDPSLIPLQQSRAALHRRKAVYLLDDRTFEISQSKILSTQLAASLGVSVPRSEVVESLAQGLAFAEAVGFPVVLKPAQSYAAAKLHRKREVMTIRSEAEVSAALAKLLDDGNLQAQEHFAGVGTGIEFLAKQGRLLYAFQHLRLHEPRKGGGSSYRASIGLHPQMLDATKKIIQSLDYSGVGMVEFRWDRGSDRWIFVEINGRFWGSLPLALAAGADFPKFLYQAQVENRSQFPAGYRVGVCCRNWDRDKNWLSEQRTGGLARFATKLIGEAAVAVQRGLVLRERSDTFTLDDPRPGMAELASMVGSVVEGGQRRLRRRVAGLALVKNRHRRRASRTVKSAKRILFVCKGNICRSPFAAAYARTVFPTGTVIHSSGYYPVSDRPSPAVAVTTAASYGVDLTAHRSRVLDARSAEAYDLIFVFDDENHHTLCSTLQGVRGKVFFLGVYSDEGLEIADPYGGDAARFDQTYRRIKSALDEVVRTLACTE